MKFKNKTTGKVVSTNDKILIYAYKHNSDWEFIEDKKTENKETYKKRKKHNKGEM